MFIITCYRESGKRAKDRYLKLDRLSKSSNCRVRFYGYGCHALWWGVAKVYVTVCDDEGDGVQISTTINSILLLDCVSQSSESNRIYLIQQHSRRDHQK
jgi:hypothetical protein